MEFLSKSLKGGEEDIPIIATPMANVKEGSRAAQRRKSTKRIMQGKPFRGGKRGRYPPVIKNHELVGGSLARKKGGKPPYPKRDSFRGGRLFSQKLLP